MPGTTTHEEIDLSASEPLIAMPSSPGNVVPGPRRGRHGDLQSYIGSSANPGYRDFAVAAAMVKGRQVHERVSFDINPARARSCETPRRRGPHRHLIAAGARIHQAGCNGCIGMGQAPATGRISLRTVPRNFPGRSGTREDRVCLCSPETAAASALTGVITDPRDLGLPYLPIEEPEAPGGQHHDVRIPGGFGRGTEQRDSKRRQTSRHCRNSSALHRRDRRRCCSRSAATSRQTASSPRARASCPTGAISPRWPSLPSRRSTTPTQSARESRDRGERHAIVAGRNYGQGSSRENAAIAPRYLGLEVVIAKSFARIHWQNLVNFGVLPLTFADPADYDRLQPGDTIRIAGIAEALKVSREIHAKVEGSDGPIRLRHTLSERQIDILLGGAQKLLQQPG